MLVGTGMVRENYDLFFWQGLRLHNEEIVRLRSTDMKNLIRHKKLYLVLDLDHTLLNSTQLVHVTAAEEYLKTQAASLQGMYLFDLCEIVNFLGS